MRTLFLTITLVHFLGVIAAAQESNYAAQLQAITKLPDDTVKVRLLNELASDLAQTDVAKALPAHAIHLFRVQGNDGGIRTAKGIIGGGFRF